jgi:hypothetical protein
MAIADLQEGADLLEDYKRYKRLIAQAQKYADEAIELKAKIQAHPLYNSDATQLEKDFIMDADVVCDTFSKAVPVAPDVVVQP